MVEILRKIRNKSFGLKNSQDFIACHKTYLCNIMGVSQDHTDLWGSQALFGQFVDLLFHVLRHQLQPGRDAAAGRQSWLGQAFPGECVWDSWWRPSGTEKKLWITSLNIIISPPPPPFFISSFTFYFVIFYFSKVNSPSYMGRELMTSRSRVSWASDWASQVSPSFSSLLLFLLLIFPLPLLSLMFLICLFFYS